MSQDLTPFFVTLCILGLFLALIGGEERPHWEWGVFQRFVSAVSFVPNMLLAVPIALAAWGVIWLGQTQLLWFTNVIAAYFTLVGWMNDGDEEDPPDDQPENE